MNYFERKKLKRQMKKEAEKLLGHPFAVSDFKYNMIYLSLIITDLFAMVIEFITRRHRRKMQKIIEDLQKEGIYL